MFIFVDDSAEAVTSTNIQVRDRGQIGDRFRQRLQRSGVGDAPVGPVPVVMPLVLVQRVQQMRLIPHQPRFVRGVSSLLAGSA